MRVSVFKEGWLFALVAAAGVAIFFVVRLLLPTGESALPPLPIRAEPPAPVFSVALPAPPAAPKLRAEEPEADIARLASRPVVRKTSVKPAVRPKARVASKPKPQATPALQLTPITPAPQPEPEPVRTIASVQPPAVPNPSPGRAKHGKSAPPGQAKKAEQRPAIEATVVIVDVAVVENPSPGREKHGKGLPPGQVKKD
jgi:hypothetical protein